MRLESVIRNAVAGKKMAIIAIFTIPIVMFCSCENNKESVNGESMMDGSVAIETVASESVTPIDLETIAAGLSEATAMTGEGYIEDTEVGLTQRDILFGVSDFENVKQSEDKETSISALSELGLPSIEEDGEYVVLQDPKMYTYNNMQRDIALLCVKHPEIVSCNSIATTDDDRELYHLVIGNPDAEHKILIDAAIHAREYITAQLVMKQCVAFVEHVAEGDQYHGIDYATLIQNCAIHVVPMVNPDGVALSQLGLEGLNKSESVEKVERIATYDGKTASGEYLRRWKANINGIDLNRNFDGKWDAYKDTIGHPSSDHYKGTAPVSETESKAMVKLVQDVSFDYITNYHAQGRVLYWYYGEKGEQLDRITKFMRVLESQTDYTADEAHHGTSDSAGYRDWTAGTLGIPSITVEVGYDYAPVDPAQFPEIWQENKNVMAEMCLLCMS